MQGTTLSRTLETLPGLAGLVQLRTGASYGVDNPSLAMALMAGPSQAGAWSAIVGAPDFGLEAAAAYGVDIDRTLVVPDPGDQWLNVVAGLIDVVSVVVVRPPGRVSDGQAARLASRLRQHEAILIAWGEWPRSEARLSLRSSSWVGLGQGHGHLAGRQAVVSIGRGSTPGREVQLWLPDASQQIRPVEQAQSAQSLLRQVV